MTEVTIENFEELLPTVISSIQNSVFIAFDLEFTGLVSEQKVTPSLFDDTNSRYSKQRVSASDFAVCQFGLATFSKDPIENKFEARNFTFYLCPKTVRDSRGKKFSCSLFSLEFLADHNFDFNKMIRQGIPYLNNAEIEQLLQDMKDPEALDEITDGHSSRGDQFKSIVSQIQKFLSTESDESNGTNRSSPPPNQILIPFDSSVNSFANYVVIKRLREMFGSTNQIWIRIVNGHLQIKKVTTQLEEEALKQSIEAEETSSIEYMIGFTRVFRMMVESKRPIVGHNLFVDLLFLYRCFHNPLPLSLRLFKQDLHEMFPIIYDTKHLYAQIKRSLPDLKDLIDSNNLTKLYEKVNRPEFLKNFDLSPPIELSTDGNLIVDPTVKPHDAGSDAFCSGVVFIKLTHALVMSGKNEKVSVGPSWIEYQMALSPYQNRANLIRATNHSINLAGSDEGSNRPPVIYVRSKRGPLDVIYIKQRIANYGDYFDIQLNGSSEALIATSNETMKRDILMEFAGDDSYDVRIYNKWKHNKCLKTSLMTGYVASTAIVVYFMLKLFK